MAGASKVVLHVLNVLNTVFALALAAGSLWFFIQVKELTNLRNSNHYLLDYNVYWPQAIPWMFMVVSVLAVATSCCGFIGASRNRKGLLSAYVVFVSIFTLLFVVAAVIAFVFADSKSTDDFIKDTVWDSYLQMKTNNDVADSFGNIERKLHCCGADGPRDYRNWKNEFPKSCCDVYYHGWLEPYTIDCDITNKLANERHGCSVVASQYARIAMKALASVSVLVGFVGIISIVVASRMIRAMSQKTRVLKAQHETESKKVLI